MKKKNLLIIIFFLLVAASSGFYWLVLRKPAEKPAGPPQISWQFEDMGRDPRTDGQLTKVKLGIKGKTYDLGTYVGNCSAMAVNLLSENEIAGVVCWWGGGEEIGVFKEEDKLLVKKRGLNESPEYPPSIKDFKQILEIK